MRLQFKSGGVRLALQLLLFGRPLERLLALARSLEHRLSLGALVLASSAGAS